MNSERLMNEQRLALLKTIRKENPSLRRYMNDIINEMENPESAFNTGKMTRPTDLDRTTAMRLCDAFAVAKMYSEKYHLDFPELIEFVSEKTLELMQKISKRSLLMYGSHRSHRTQFLSLFCSGVVRLAHTKCEVMAQYLVQTAYEGFKVRYEESRT